MQYLHYDVTLSSGDQVVVSLDKQANVLLLDNSNFSNYRSGRSYKYFGGLAKVSPISITAPTSGEWHVVINTGGYSGTVRASVEVRRR